MASIQQRLDDKRLSIIMEEYVRQIEETDWNTLRIGLRLTLRYRQTYSETPRLAVGLCSGTANTYYQASTDHFLGVLSTSANWTFTTSNSPLFYYYRNITFAPVVRIGTSNSLGSNYAANYQVQSWIDDSSSMFLVEIRKGSPSWEICLKTSTNVDGYIFSENDLKDAMSAGWSDINVSAGPDAGITRNVDEATNGVLDSVNIAWDRDRGMEIADLLIQRIS